MSFYGQYTGFGGGGGPVYESFITILGDLSLTTGLKLCLDAGDSVSYPSGQDWIDRSGNIGADEFHRGSTTGSDANDPIFNGSAGGLSSNEYFSFDGADYLTYGATSETWMNNLHKNSAKFSIAVWVYHGTSASQSCLVGTEVTSGNRLGMKFELEGGDEIRILVRDGSAIDLDVQSDNGISEGAWHFVALVLDEAAGAGGSFFYADGGYMQVSSANTFDGTYTTPSASNSGKMQLGAVGDGGTPMVNGSRMAGAMLWEATVPTKTNLDSIWDDTKGRFGL